MASTLAVSPIERRPFSQGRGNRSFFLVAVLIVAIIAEAVVVVFAALSIADITSLSVAPT
jgi:uncharacterized membrane protein YhaH (DUF805 family)